MLDIYCTEVLILQHIPQTHWCILCHLSPLQL